MKHRTRYILDIIESDDCPSEIILSAEYDDKKVEYKNISSNELIERDPCTGEIKLKLKVKATRI